MNSHWNISVLTTSIKISGQVLLTFSSQNQDIDIIDKNIDTYWSEKIYSI